MTISSPHWWQPEALAVQRAARSLRFAVVETALWLAVYGGSLLTGYLALGGYDRAVANSRGVVGIEHALGVFVEPAVHERIAGIPALSAVFSAYYVILFGPVTFGLLVWLARHRRANYLELRTQMVLALALASLVFIVFPAAPPRLTPGLGIADTVGLGGGGHASFFGVRFNPYAAVPSMHVGWAVLVAAGWARVVQSRLLRALLACHPVLMTLTVVATGNHLLTDAVLGATVSGLASLAIRSRGRIKQRRLRRRISLGWLFPRRTMPALG